MKRGRARSPGGVKFLCVMHSRGFCRAQVIGRVCTLARRRESEFSARCTAKGAHVPRTPDTYRVQSTRYTRYVAPGGRKGGGESRGQEEGKGGWSAHGMGDDWSVPFCFSGGVWRRDSSGTLSERDVITTPLLPSQDGRAVGRGPREGPPPLLSGAQFAFSFSPYPRGCGYTTWIKPGVATPGIASLSFAPSIFLGWFLLAFLLPVTGREIPARRVSRRKPSTVERR